MKNLTTLLLALILLFSCVSLAETAEITSDEYLAATESQWFATGKVDYVIHAMMVTADTPVYNPYEDVDYVAKPDGIDVIMKGSGGEGYVSKLTKVVKNYTDPDGAKLTAAYFTPDTWMPVRTIPTSGCFACYIPLETKVSVQTAWGDLLHANRVGVPHGKGDYLVCYAGQDGQPDLSDVWVVNGEIFATTYDLTNAQ